MQKKLAYIAHMINAPSNFEISNNIDRVLNIVRHITFNEPGFVAYAPYIPDLLVLDDNNLSQRELGIQNALAYVTKADEVRVYGNITKGISMEIDKAHSMNIPVYQYDSVTLLPIINRNPAINPYNTECENIITTVCRFYGVTRWLLRQV